MATSRVEAISLSYQEKMEGTPVELVGIGVVLLLVFVVVGSLIASYLKRRKIKKRKMQRKKERERNESL